MKGKSFGIIYGTNKTLELVMPVNGQILFSNTDVLNHPQTLNSDSYHNWITLMTIKNYKTVKSDFLTASDYKMLDVSDFVGKLN